MSLEGRGRAHRRPDEKIRPMRRIRLVALCAAAFVLAWPTGAAHPVCSPLRPQRWSRDRQQRRRPDTAAPTFTATFADNGKVRQVVVHHALDRERVTTPGIAVAYIRIGATLFAP